jgi:hypothetical protein
MYRSTRITSAVAVVASALALAPAAFAGGVTPDNRADRTGPAGLAVVPAAVTPDNRADRTGPAGLAAVAAPAAPVGSGFEWADAGIGAAAGFAAALACAGAAAGVRSRRRLVA